jgi:thioredoxin-like negative regulator of GroEL
MNGAQLAIRLAIAVVISLLGVSAFWGWNHLQLRRLGRARGAALRGLETMRAGVPGILYFTTPDCQVCITTQKPALKRLEAELGAGLQIVEVDATVQPELADYWGVLSVPTTFIIDGSGQPRHINHGLTGKDKLRRQIEDARQGNAQAGSEIVAAQQRAGAAEKNVG